MNKILYILPITLFLFLSDLSADTGEKEDFFKKKLVPTEQEVREAVVQALLAQERQGQEKKPVVLEKVPPKVAQEKLSPSIRKSKKIKEENQDLQRIKIRNIVAIANKKTIYKKLANVAKKEDMDASKVSKITLDVSKKSTMTPLIVTENVKDKSVSKQLDVTAKNEDLNKPVSQSSNANDIPVGRNQLLAAVVAQNKLKLSEKTILEPLAIKQALTVPLSRNSATSGIDTQLSDVKETVNREKKSTLQGWIYLGRFESGKWESQTLDVEGGLPQVGKQYVVKATSLYVRAALPKKGKMAKVIHAFHTKDQIKILKLKSLGRNRDFYWAEVLRE